ncbi:hypothetical protein [Amycolatopsis rubida]|uniref:hypothetical protein n=1 Tax=Amycolatopsis rubida TaxID=112413 RepID=UPI003139AB18
MRREAGHDRLAEFAQIGGEAGQFAGGEPGIDEQSPSPPRTTTALFSSTSLRWTSTPRRLAQHGDALRS